MKFLLVCKQMSVSCEISVQICMKGDSLMWQLISFKLYCIELVVSEILYMVYIGRFNYLNA